MPDPETIRRTAQEVVRRPEFQLRPVHDSRFLWDLLWRILRPILHFFAGLWDISPVLAWAVIIGLTVVAIALIVHIAFMFRTALARRTQFGDSLGRDSRKTDPIELERRAEDAAVREDFITAVRLLFRAACLRIAHTEKRVAPGTTNREYLRRYSKSEYAGALQQFVDVIDAKWYGLGLCSAGDFQSCRRAHAAICTASEVKHAHRA